MLPDNILFSANPGQDLKEFVAQKNYSKIGVLVDENTLKHCYPLIRDYLPAHFTIETKSGESEKNLQTCASIWTAMTDNTLDRHSCIIVLGGGVLGDMGGFCASTYKRGIDFILVPTTLLAQADSSIGGKLGIDFNHFKNHIGVFQQPSLTILHIGFLKSLPQAELRSGFAEIIKHSLIADKDLWEEIRRKPLADQNWDALIRHSVQFKARVTAEDPTEKGLRKILNAGHTIGHALETYLLNSGTPVLHGEAVAVGLVAEGFIATRRGLLRTEDFQNMSTYISSVYGKVGFQSNELDPIGAIVLQDKKNKENRILCVLLNGIGDAKWDCEISLDEVKDALTFYLSL
jgi:3-dehydroquinate synthase